jgi:hypothetical protein
MNISSLGASLFGGASTPLSSAGSAAAASPAPAGADASASSGGSDALQYLENYLKESPAQRMEDAWLAKHHLSESQLEAMPPAQRDAIKKQMADDIKQELQAKTGGKTGTIANVTA